MTVTMKTRSLVAFAAVAFALAGCAHKPLSGSSLDEVRAPAFISRIEENAGPRSEVFREDASYAPKLKRLAPKEADRRLTVKLEKAMGRFEIAERLRASTFALLPQERPWSSSLDPAQVSSQLQQFLVHEVPANSPDYNLVKELGADSVVEFVIEEYGMRSRGGKAQAYLVGYGRMFRIGGGELWRRNFEVDMAKEAAFDKLDPFRVAKEPELWRNTMSVMLDAVARQFAQDLNPPGRTRSSTPSENPGEVTPASEEAPPQQATTDEVGAPAQSDELPDPDPI